MVRQMSGPRQMDRILDTVRERQLEFPLPMKQYSPQDMAAHLLLTNPKLFRELHAELAVTRYRLVYVDAGGHRVGLAAAATEVRALTLD